MLFMTLVLFLFGVLLVFNGYYTHRLNKPEFFAGLASGVSFGFSILALSVYVGIK